MNNSYTTLRLILGDQLNQNHSWFKETNDQTLYVMMEMRQETDYTVHHVQKVLAFFLAMRCFSKEMEEKGHHFLYLNLNDEINKQNLSDNITRIIDQYKVQSFEYQLPDEYRLDQQLIELSNKIDIKSTKLDSEHFLSQRDDLKKFFEGKKSFLMESFYRSMRKRYNILMESDGETPLTGKWNYDHSNRKKLPKKIEIPAPKEYTHDVTDLKSMIEAHGIKTMGRHEGDNLLWPISRDESLRLLHFFYRYCLPQFGDFQDAMHTDYWSLFHSRLSFALNVKLISPLEVIEKCIDHWQENKDTIDISQIEGFVRQILGWREYMRGIYWTTMPSYAKENYFNNKRALPKWYWDGNTKMNCLKHAIDQSLDFAYAHHIQRLMITGNFALLAGCHPDEVDAWYLGIYIDAIEWVEITNTRGMSQYADGGLLATKPYVSSANYIQKMSNYCQDCYYNYKDKVGEKACPFNSLYWNFIDQHANLLSDNPRMGMMYSLWEKKSSDEKEALLIKANEVLKDIETL